MKPWELLESILRHGDQRALAKALHVSPQLVHSWTIPPRYLGGDGQRSPVECIIEMVKILRAEDNPEADKIVHGIAAETGFFVFKLMPGEVDDAKFAALLRDVSDVVRTKADAEYDGHVTPEEHRQIAKEVGELIERANAYRIHQYELAEREERRAQAVGIA